MKALISIFIVAACAFMGMKLMQQWDASKNAASVEPKPAPVIATESLPGMDGSLETAFADAKKRGVTGLRDFLTRYGRTIRDPRRAAIELDYAALLLKNDPVEARKIFNRVKQRTPESSPVYPRVKQLEKMYQ
jgi:hypothetical protein